MSHKGDGLIVRNKGVKPLPTLIPDRGRRVYASTSLYKTLDSDYGCSRSVSYRQTSTQEVSYSYEYFTVMDPGTPGILLRVTTDVYLSGDIFYVYKYDLLDRYLYEVLDPDGHKKKETYGIF